MNTKRRPVQGRNSVEKILWASLWVPGPHGRRGLPWVLEGDPGKAKSAITKEIAQLANIYFEVVTASIRSPQDFLGMPQLGRMKLTPQNQHLSPDGDDSIGVCNYAPPGWALRSAGAKRGLVLFDEGRTCPPTVQAAMLRVFFEGVAGDLPIPEGVRMWMATNSMEDSPGGHDIALPLKNRIGLLEYDGPGVSRFKEYLTLGGGCRISGKLIREVKPVVDPRVEEAEVDAAWGDAWASAAGTIAGFLEANSSAAHQKPTMAERAKVWAWPSLRTWDFACACRAMGYIYDLSATEIQTATAAFVGAGAEELFEWERLNDLPNAQDWLDGKIQFDHDPRRLDRTSALLTSATATVVSPTCATRNQRSNRLWKYLLGLPADAIDVSMSSVIALCNAKLMLGDPDAYRVFARLEPFMVAAGITPPEEGS